MPTRKSSMKCRWTRGPFTFWTAAIWIFHDWPGSRPARFTLWCGPKPACVSACSSPAPWIKPSGLRCDQTIALTQFGTPDGSPPPSLGALKYTQPEPRVMLIEGEIKVFADGKFGMKKVTARLRHYGRDEFLLSSRGFHWINETPYNQFGPKNEPPPKIQPPLKRP